MSHNWTDIAEGQLSESARLCLLRRCLRGLEWEGRLVRKLYVSKDEVYRDDLCVLSAILGSAEATGRQWVGAEMGGKGGPKQKLHYQPLSAEQNCTELLRTK
jgi:hypothetical protein